MVSSSIMKKYLLLKNLLLKNIPNTILAIQYNHTLFMAKMTKLDTPFMTKTSADT